jgi:hypothetical protein
MPLILGANSVTGGYEVDNSLRFNDGSSDYLSQTFSTPTNNRKYTFSSWVKRGSNLGDRTAIFGAGLDGNNENYIGFNSDNTFYYYVFSNPSQYRYVSSGVYRDVSAWYHCVVAVDTTLADADDRVILYINGERVVIGTQQSIPQNFDSRINSAVNHGVGYSGNTSFAYYWDGYQAETVFIDGQQLDPTSFGEFDEDSGIWKPIAYEGTYGTNGFYLEFKDSSALGDDTSGEGNDFTVNNLTSIDQTTDTPTNNFATLNPLYVGLNANFGLSEGNLKGLNSGAGENNYVSNFGVSSGKWYVEAKATVSGTAYGTIGIVATDSVLQTNGSWLGSTNDSWYYSQNGDIGTNGGSTSTGHDTYTTGDIISVALNLDDNELLWYKNGAVQNSGTATSITANKTYFIGGRVYDTSTGWEFNFGSPPFAITTGNEDANGYGNFEYAVPPGYYALCTKNLAEYG